MFEIEGVNTRDIYFQSLRNNFEYEFEFLCARIVGNNYVCVDIGANVGVKTIMLAQAANRGTVLAIEPAPSIYGILTRNIRRSGLTNIISRQTAVSDHSGTVFFEENSAYGHIADSGIPVKTSTLSDILRETKLSQADFIKIDVEGFEFPILLSSLDIINSCRSVVLFELNLWCLLAFARTNPLDLLEWVTSVFSEVYVFGADKRQGFTLSRITPSDCLAILHDMITKGHSIIDLLATNAPERLVRALALSTWPSAASVISRA